MPIWGSIGGVEIAANIISTNGLQSSGKAGTISAACGAAVTMCCHRVFGPECLHELSASVAAQAVAREEPVSGSCIRPLRESPAEGVLGGDHAVRSPSRREKA